MFRILWVFILLSSSLLSIAHAQTSPPAAESSVQTQTDTAARVDAPAPAPEPVNVRGAEASRAQASGLLQWWERSDWLLVIPTWLIAFVSLGLAIYAARLWKAATTLSDDGKEVAKKELRAYVALDEIFFSESSDAAGGLHKLRIRNYGQTPASGMSIWCERASHLPQEGVKPFYDSPVVDGQLLHPVQAFTVGLSAAPLYRIGKPGFFTYGRIVYHDIYSRWWVTKFCYRYEGDGTFVPHGDYNNEEGPFDKAPA